MPRLEPSDEEEQHEGGVGGVKSKKKKKRSESTRDINREARRRGGGGSNVCGGGGSGRELQCMGMGRGGAPAVSPSPVAPGAELAAGWGQLGQVTYGVGG